MKRLIFCIAAICMVLSTSVSTTVVYASSTTYTYTKSSGASWIETSDAYVISEIMYKDYDLNNPEDLFLKDKLLYVADTGNKRIIRTDLNTGKSECIISEGLSSPEGVFVTDAGEIYVADSALAKVLKFSGDGTLLKEYARPTETVFGESAKYAPKKVVVDEYGTLYIISEGSYDGIIKMNQDGTFMNYYGSNDASSSVITVIQDLIFTDEQKEKLFTIIPDTFKNLTRSSNGIIYTATYNAKGNAVKKHNLAGGDLYALKDEKVYGESNFVDIAVGTYGQIYALGMDGMVYEYQDDGTLVYTFGGQAIDSERNGLITVGASIVVDEDNCLYVLDKQKGFVHVYVPTDMTETIHKAIDEYQKGRYEESLTYWNKVLKRSANSLVAHQGAGKCYLQLKEYEAAMHHFELAEDKQGYSEVYWEVRNNAITQGMVPFLICILVLSVVSSLIKFWDKKKKIFDPVRRWKNKLCESKLVKDLTFIKHMVYHPMDGFYEIKVGREGSFRGATIIYLILYVFFVIYTMYSGFLIRNDNLTLGFVTVVFAAVIFLWIICNFMVSEITDGQGYFKEIYRMTAYALSPMVLILPVLILFSYVYTFNESFVITFGIIIMCVWSAVLLYLGLQEIHGFGFKEVMQNIALTLVSMFIVLFIAFILFLLWSRVADVVYQAGKEIIYRVYS